MKKIMKKSVAFFCIPVLLSGCVSTQFTSISENEYAFSKMSDACAAGSPTSLLNHLRGEAIKFCAGRKEIPIEISSSTEMGIPYVRCTSGILRFKCEAPQEGAKK